MTTLRTLADDVTEPRWGRPSETVTVPAGTTVWVVTDGIVVPPWMVWLTNGTYGWMADRDTLDTIAPVQRPGAWVIGHNMPGYLPEADTYAYASWSEARDAWADMMRAWADEDDEAHEELDCGHGPDDEDMAEHLEDCYGSTRAVVDSVLADMIGADGQDWAILVRDNEDRATTWWIQWDGDRLPGDHE